MCMSLGGNEWREYRNRLVIRLVSNPNSLLVPFAEKLVVTSSAYDDSHGLEAKHSPCKIRCICS